jgi:hypothetical protein
MDRHFIALSSVILVLAGVVLLVLPVGWFPSFYDARYSGLAALLGALVIQLIPRFFGISGDSEKDGPVREFQLLLTAFIIGNTAGELGLFHIFHTTFQYDKLLHFGISFISAWRMPALVERRYGIKPVRALLAALIGVIIIGVLWEGYEFAVDAVWETRLHGTFGNNVRPDTIADIVSNTLGAVCGALLTILKARQSSSSAAYKPL